MKDSDINNNSKCAEALAGLHESLVNGKFSSADLNDQVSLYPECEKQLRDAHSLWMELGQLDVPSVPEGAKNRFLTTLNEFEKKHKVHRIRKPGNLFTVLKWAAVFIIGLSTGVFLANRNKTDHAAGNPVLPNQFLTSLHDSKSATEKLRVLQTLKENNNPEEYVYEALYKTILNDPNVNVRLSAIEAMLHFSDRPKVRMLLIQALTFQESAIVQLSLAEVIIKLQDNESMEEIKKLLNSDKLLPEVKMHLKETLSQI